MVVNHMLLPPGLRHRGMVHGPLLINGGMGHHPLLFDRGMGHRPLLVDCGMIEGSLLTDGGSSRIRATPRWHHGRTVVPLGPDRTDKNTAQ